ncbi:hypothetical protein [Frigidibacter sp. MR17.24]|uniref:hypothetical protein n=1 Tax=Frigidibacter sp. MR17.24 TaxID=3127345 RepID=UPI003012AE98
MAANRELLGDADAPKKKPVDMAAGRMIDGDDSRIGASPETPLMREPVEDMGRIARADAAMKPVRVVADSVDLTGPVRSGVPADIEALPYDGRRTDPVGDPADRAPVHKDIPLGPPASGQGRDEDVPR